MNEAQCLLAIAHPFVAPLRILVSILLVVVGALHAQGIPKTKNMPKIMITEDVLYTEDVIVGGSILNMAPTITETSRR